MAVAGSLPKPDDGMDQRIKRAIHGALPDAFVWLEPLASHRRIAKVVAEALNDLSSVQQQEVIWEALRRELSEDAQYISMVVTYGTDEL